LMLDIANVLACTHGAHEAVHKGRLAMAMF
jgi:hypothetical protein